MSLFSIIILAAIAIAAIYAVMLYNSLVSVKHNVSKAWANIDVLLKQRHDEIPSWWRYASNTASSSRTPSRG